MGGRAARRRARCSRETRDQTDAVSDSTFLSLTAFTLFLLIIFCELASHLFSDDARLLRRDRLTLDRPIYDDRPSSVMTSQPSRTVAESFWFFMVFCHGQFPSGLCSPGVANINTIEPFEGLTGKNRSGGEIWPRRCEIRVRRCARVYGRKMRPSPPLRLAVPGLEQVGYWLLAARTPTGIAPAFNDRRLALFCRLGFRLSCRKPSSSRPR